VSFILDLSLSWTVGKYCLVAEAFWLIVHCRCVYVCMSISMNVCMYVRVYV